MVVLGGLIGGRRGYRPAAKYVVIDNNIGQVACWPLISGGLSPETALWEQAV